MSECSPNCPEILTSVQFISSFLGQVEISEGDESAASEWRSMVSHFQAVLCQLMCLKFKGHWWIGFPYQGNGYRSMVNRHATGEIDEVVRLALADSGMPTDNEWISSVFHVDFVLWTDPGVVSVRLGPDHHLSSPIEDLYFAEEDNSFINNNNNDINLQDENNANEYLLALNTLEEFNNQLISSGINPSNMEETAVPLNEREPLILTNPYEGQYQTTLVQDDILLDLQEEDHQFHFVAPDVAHIYNAATSRTSATSSTFGNSKPHTNRSRTSSNSVNGTVYYNNASGATSSNAAGSSSNESPSSIVQKSANTEFRRKVLELLSEQGAASPLTPNSAEAGKEKEGVVSNNGNNNNSGVMADSSTSPSAVNNATEL